MIIRYSDGSVVEVKDVYEAMEVIHEIYPYAVFSQNECGLIDADKDFFPENGIVHVWKGMRAYQTGDDEGMVAEIL